MCDKNYILSASNCPFIVAMNQQEVQVIWLRKI
jgi:hypothetical protein